MSNFFGTMFDDDDEMGAPASNGQGQDVVDRVAEKLKKTPKPTISLGVTAPLVSLPEPPFNPASFAESELGALKRRISFMDPAYGSNAPVMAPPRSRFRDAMFLAGNALSMVNQMPYASPIAKAIGVLGAALMGAWKGGNVGGMAVAKARNEELREQGQREWQDVMREIATRRAAEQLTQETIQTQALPTELDQQRAYKDAQLRSIQAQEQQRRSSAELNQTRAEDLSVRTNQQLVLGGMNAIVNAIKAGQDPTYLVYALNGELVKRGLSPIPVPEGKVLRRVYQNGAGQTVLVYTTPNNDDVEEVALTPNAEWTSLQIQRLRTQVEQNKAKAAEAQTRANLNNARARQTDARTQKLQTGETQNNEGGGQKPLTRKQQIRGVVESLRRKN